MQAENVDFRNCVMYNAQGTCYGGPGGGQINIVNNYYKAWTKPQFKKYNPERPQGKRKLRQGTWKPGPYHASNRINKWKF